MSKYKVIGLMSGTSLDGLDLAYCVFKKEGKKWSFSIRDAITLKYNSELTKKLGNAHTLSSTALLKLHNEYGACLGQCVKAFIEDKKIGRVDFISSHGHTVFHQPENHFTFQLGHGAAVASASGCPVVSDFRSLDVTLGGQGAPLVPVGDKLLFSEYTYCLNIGGFANISYKHKGDRIAFDICPANIALNHLASLHGKEYDKDGKLAEKGKVDKALLSKLNALTYYKKTAPKSLGREWFEKEFLPIVDKAKLNNIDKIATVTEHIAIQIAAVVKGKKGKLLATGGGALNKHLIQRIKKHAPNIKIVVPGKELVNYKEALVFALLGVLRWRGEVNSLKSVTGASKNNSGGSIFL